MKRVLCIIPVILVFASCVHKSMEEKICEEARVYIQNMNKCDQDYFVYNLGPKPYSFLGYQDTYFLWKKYGLVVKTDAMYFAFDSCFCSQMNEKAENYYGEEFMNLLRLDLDSILQSKRNKAKLSFHDVYFYYDGVASYLPVTRFKNMKNASIIDEHKKSSLFNSLKDSLNRIELLRSNGDGFIIRFWYTVDTLWFSPL